jgi:hypothetical protein
MTPKRTKSIFSQLPFFKGGKSIMIPRILANNLSSLWERPVESLQVEPEAGRDFYFWKGRSDPLNCYPFPDF